MKKLFLSTVAILLSYASVFAAPFLDEDLIRRNLSLNYLESNLSTGIIIERGDSFELSVDYFSSEFEPAQINAVIGSRCHSLSLLHGTRRNGNYSLMYKPDHSGCIPVRFQVERTDGVVIRFPRSYSIAIAAGEYCSFFLPDVQEIDCSVVDGTLALRNFQP